MTLQNQKVADEKEKYFPKILICKIQQQLKNLYSQIPLLIATSQIAIRFDSNLTQSIIRDITEEEEKETDQGFPDIFLS